MNKEPDSCPHCGGVDLSIRNRIPSGVVLACQNLSCLARIWGHNRTDAIERWNRREPGPATKTILDVDEEALGAMGKQKDDPQYEIILNFLREWGRLPEGGKT